MNNAKRDLNLIMNVNLESKCSIDTELSFINKDDLSNLFLNDAKKNNKLFNFRKGYYNF